MEQHKFSDEDIAEFAPLTREQVEAIDAENVKRLDNALEHGAGMGLASHDFDKIYSWRSWPDRARRGREVRERDDLHEGRNVRWGNHVARVDALTKFDIAMLERRAWRGYACAAMCSGAEPSVAADRANRMMALERERFGDEPKPPTAEER